MVCFLHITKVKEVKSKRSGRQIEKAFWYLTEREGNYTAIANYS